jgi:alpha-glucoside transport system substrate-binding protein
MAKRNWWLMAVLTVVVAVACSTAAPTGAPTGAPTAVPTAAPTNAPGVTDAPATDAPATDAPATEPPPPVAALPSVPTGFAELDAALGADKPFNGTRATIQTQWIGGEGANFAAAIADFEAATGIDIVVDSIGTSHETVLRTRIEGNDPTLNMAMLAQPAAILAYGAEGKLVDVNSFMPGSKLTDEHPATVGLYTDAAGATYGIPYKVDVKSTIWYPIKAFEAAGYTVPTTWDELMTLADTIVASGSAPFCVGIESGTATGWEATDLLEDIMLRTTSVENYNKWITHELPFNSPEVLNAMNLMAQYYFTDGYVLGGTDAILGIHLTDPMDPMFPGTPPGTSNDWTGFTPGCWMHKIPTWYGPDFFPDVKANPGSQTIYPIGEDIGIFYFPGIDEAYGTPALGAGDALIVITPPDGSAVAPQVMAAAQFLSLPEGLQRWIEAGSAISANQTTPADWYAGAYKLSVAAGIVNNATGFGFDASDLMPPEVGAGEEWVALSDWIAAGGADTEAILQRIDDAWPQ